MKSVAYDSMQILDVLEYERWADNFGSLARINRQNMRDILNVAGLPKPGEVIFFLSKDRLRARAIICVSKRPAIFTIAPVAFDPIGHKKLSAELALSLWVKGVFEGDPYVTEQIKQMSWAERVKRVNRALRKLGIG